MLGKLSSSLTALGKHRTRNKEDRGRPAANALQLQLQRLSRFEPAGLARLGSMYRSPRLGSARRAARAGSCRLGSGWLRLVELLQHYDSLLEESSLLALCERATKTYPG